MRRRPFLASAGLGLAVPLAGCGEALGGTTPSASSGASSESGTEAKDDGRASVEIVGVDADPAPELPVEPAVSDTTTAATETEPAGLAICWENLSEASVRVGEANSIVFSAIRSEDENAYLLAFGQIGGRSDAVSDGECWYVAEPPVLDGDYEFVDLEPGERHSAEPDLYADSDACLSSGSYRFETIVSVEDRYGQEERSERWGFTLDIQTG